MNELLILMKQMRRAMQPYVLFLYELVFEANAKSVLEIGFRQGQSTRTILSALKDRKDGKLTTISIDLPDSKGRVTEDLLPFWETYSSNSHDEKCKTFLGDRKFEVIFIDGDHNYEGVKQDFEMYSEFVAPGGYIIFHDVLNPNCGVPKFWQEVKKETDKYEVLTLNYGFAGVGVLRAI